MHLTWNMPYVNMRASWIATLSCIGVQVAVTAILLTAHRTQDHSQLREATVVSMVMEPIGQQPSPPVTLPPTTAAVTTPPPSLPFPEGCVQAPIGPGEAGCTPHEQTICLLRDVMVRDNKIHSPRRAFALNVINIGPLTIHPMPTDPVIPTRVLEGLTVVLHRMYPGNYAHATRDTLAHVFFAFTTFYHEGRIDRDLHMIFVDAVQTTGNVREVMYAIGNTTLEGTGQEVILARRAVVGMYGHCPVDNCEHHYLRPRGWRALSNLMASRHALAPPASLQRTVIWFANRNPGESREVVNMAAIAAHAIREFPTYQCIDARPGAMNLSMQVTMARRALVMVSPHGSSLASMIWGGPDVSVVELLAPSFLSGWWFAQAKYQGSRWVSVLGQRDGGDGRIEADPVLVKEQIQGLLLDYPISCQNPGLPTTQACTSAPKSIDAVLSLIEGYGYDQYKHLVVSFRRWHRRPDVKLILFGGNADCPDGDRVWCVSLADLDGGSGRPETRRFRIYDSFMARHAGTLRHVFFTDSRDVFFQGDVFGPGRMTAQGVHLFAENYQLQHEKAHNQPWVRDCRGEAFLEQMLANHAPIINGGVFAASSPDYASLFIRQLSPMLEKCNDQGAVTILGYELSFSSHVFPTRVHYASNESWVTHMPIEHLGNGEYGQIRNARHDAEGRLLCDADNTPYAVVHQADRFPDLWARRGVDFP